MTRFLLLASFLISGLPLSSAEAEGRSAIRVAIFEGPGVGPSCDPLLEALDAATLQVSRIDPAAIRAGGLKDFDVLIHPGGSGGKQGEALGPEGREAVREFVGTGGGFIGICAGAYLATDDYSWSLGLIEARVIDKKHWARGTGSVEVALSPAAREFFGTGAETIPIHYAQGPLLVRREWDNPEAPEYESLGVYRTGVAKNGAPEGIMPGTSAIVRASFAKGRVFVFSPHPEKTEGLGHLVKRAVFWAAGKNENGESGPPPSLTTKLPTAP